MSKTRISLFIGIGIVIGFILGLTTYPVLAEDTNVQVEVNGKSIDFPDQKPFIDRPTGRTYIPMRRAGEALGCNITWDQDTKTVNVQKPGSPDVIQLQIGSKTPKLNGLPMANDLDAPARLEGLPGGTWRTVVPLRFISETMGLNVLWDGGNRLVRISDKPFIAAKELTAEQKARLMAYPYPADQNGKTYEVTHKMVEAKEYYKGLSNPNLPGSILEYMMQPIHLKAIIKSNQRFITDADLCYSSMVPEGDQRIRGILQTYNTDGTITEQDIEYGFAYGAEFVRDGQPIQGSHWLNDQVIVQLSKPKRVQ